MVNPYSKTVGLPVPSNFATVYHLFFQYKSTHWTTVLMDLLQCHTQSYESVQNETARANYQAVNETGTHYLAALLLLEPLETSNRQEPHARSTGATRDKRSTGATGAAATGDEQATGATTGATGDERSTPGATRAINRSHWRQAINRTSHRSSHWRQASDRRSHYWSHWRRAIDRSHTRD